MQVCCKCARNGSCLSVSDARLEPQWGCKAQPPTTCMPHTPGLAGSLARKLVPGMAFSAMPSGSLPPLGHSSRVAGSQPSSAATWLATSAPHTASVTGNAMQRPSGRSIVTCKGAWKDAICGLPWPCTCCRKVTGPHRAEQRHPPQTSLNCSSALPVLAVQRTSAAAAGRRAAGRRAARRLWELLPGDCR